MYTHALELARTHACTHTHTLYSCFALSMNISESTNISEVPQDQVQLLSDLIAHQSSLALLSDSTPPLGPRRKGIFCIIRHRHPCSSMFTLLMLSHGSLLQCRLQGAFLGAGEPSHHAPQPLPSCRMNLCHLSEVLI